MLPCATETKPPLHKSSARWEKDLGPSDRGVRWGGGHERNGCEPAKSKPFLSSGSVNRVPIDHGTPIAQALLSPFLPSGAPPHEGPTFAHGLGAWEGKSTCEMAAPSASSVGDAHLASLRLLRT